MLSVVLAIRNNRAQAGSCLLSLVRAFKQLDVPPAALEYVLVDDESEPQQQIPELLRQFRDQVEPAVSILLFRQHQHYSRGLAYAFSVARGDEILFVSHDMVVTGDYIRTVRDVARLDESIGIVRGVSPAVDCFPQHCVTPDVPIGSSQELDGFAASVQARHQLEYVEDDLLTGDSMLIKRQVIEKIGVFDPRYYGYFGDIDFGLRAQRAGFKLVCAKGGWLLHSAAGAYKDMEKRSQQSTQSVTEQRMRIVNDAYKLFRKKWHAEGTLPPEYRGYESINFAALRAGPAPDGGDYVGPLALPSPDVGVLERFGR